MRETHTRRITSLDTRGICRVRPELQHARDIWFVQMKRVTDLVLVIQPWCGHSEYSLPYTSHGGVGTVAAVNRNYFKKKKKRTMFEHRSGLLQTIGCSGTKIKINKTKQTKEINTQALWDEALFPLKANRLPLLVVRGLILSGDQRQNCRAKQEEGKLEKQDRTVVRKGQKGRRQISRDSHLPSATRNV